MGIVIAAILATSASAWFGYLLIKSWTCWIPIYLRVIVGAVFLSPIVNLCVKKPLFTYTQHALDVPTAMAAWPWWFAGFVLLVIGVIEEAVKMSPALFASVRKEVRERESSVPMAFAIGLGFALGEIWYVAYRVTVTNPEVAQMPFYMLSGFISERLATVVLHSCLTWIAFRGLLLRNRSFLAYGALAMLAHAAVDASPLLYQMKKLEPLPVGLNLILLTLVCAVPFWRYGGRWTSGERSRIIAASGRILYVDSPVQPGGQRNPDDAQGEIT